MAQTEHLNEIMAEVGSILELEEVLGFAEDSMWTLQVDEATMLFADLLPEQGRLVISGEVARPSEAGRAAAYELILQYNNQWKTTGGVRMALDGPNGTVVQICDFPADGLTPTGLVH